ncbi:SDR family oxidoreductase [Frankia sp. CNm7]|uniref:SDR family oxidoreductase n=1 Tax=Frankia nepalensis TaxID=1836974 RepID=A0A937RIF3_9ACTN|nr:SDR family NAD(P)-dependent oxidoreductase [Frankia nepalensis]MBL7497509.1 SDR family oxidoreductase [Frankia nepalensis]MBL7510224.1 SDR family oxidoreductase [Frankia nepalensis]MBL7523252.1 SDR family oxidoreductase [Frankia nepalensis]MBL7630935.1 SDR family oxidoreductase [Frankia nepalensis]
METGLTGRTVVVTGANANIGRGIALAFAAEGTNVVIVGRDERRGQQVRETLLGAGAKDVLWQAADVTDRAQVGAMVAAVLARFEAIDVLVNNVGGNVDIDAFVDTDPETWQQDIALNLLSTLNCTHAVLPGMIAHGHGRIINIGSTAGILGDPLIAVYSAMKGAVHAFSKVLAKEVGKQGITVNAIAPYGTLPTGSDDVSSGSRWHANGLFARLGATRREELHSIGRRTVLTRQTAYPSEIGAAAVYLASDTGAFVTGQVLAIDGGIQLA